MRDHGFTHCSCYSEGVHVWSDDGEVWLSLWTSNYWYGSRLNWRERVRHAWHVITTGEPFHDQLCLSPQEARMLAGRLEGAAGVEDASGEITLTITVEE